VISGDLGLRQRRTRCPFRRCALIVDLADPRRITSSGSRSPRPESFVPRIDSIMDRLMGTCRTERLAPSGPEGLDCGEPVLDVVGEPLQAEQLQHGALQRLLAGVPVPSGNVVEQFRQLSRRHFLE